MAIKKTQDVMNENVEGRAVAVKDHGCQTGFTILEVLVSMFIMVIGILGVASLQMTSMTLNRDALKSVEANQLISDLVDRISANPDATYGPVALGDVPETSSNCATSNCTADQMATYDISNWLCAINSQDNENVPYPACVLLGVDGSFTRGKGSITLVGDEYRILLQWADGQLDEVRSAELYLGAN
jgi:type IV pilus assembly protein PilV